MNNTQKHGFFKRVNLLIAETMAAILSAGIWFFVIGSFIILIKKLF